MAEQSPYDKGLEAGKVLQRLDGHDVHFTRLNGSMEKVAANEEKVAAALNALTLAVQRLGDQAVSRDATVITTAAALKDAEQARRDQSERSWSPLSRALAVVGAMVALGTFVLYIVR